MPPKRPVTQEKENDAFVLFTPERPPPPPAKRTRRSLPDVTSAEFQVQWERAKEERRARDKREEEAKQNAAAAAERAEEVAVAAGLTGKLRAAIASLKDHGFETLNDFLAALYTTRDAHLSSTITKLIDRHGIERLEAMRKRSPDYVQKWMLDKVSAMVQDEGRHLAQELRPTSGAKLAASLEQWSLEHTLAKAKEVAPTLLELLRTAGEKNHNAHFRRTY